MASTCVSPCSCIHLLATYCIIIPLGIEWYVWGCCSSEDVWHFHSCSRWERLRVYIWCTRTSYNTFKVWIHGSKFTSCQSTTYHTSLLGSVEELMRVYIRGTVSFPVRHYIHGASTGFAGSTSLVGASWPQQLFLSLLHRWHEFPPQEVPSWPSATLLKKNTLILLVGRSGVRLGTDGAGALPASWYPEERELLIRLSVAKMLSHR